jgi:hypothetical protein
MSASWARPDAAHGSPEFLFALADVRDFGRGVRAVHDYARVGTRWTEPEIQAERRREIERRQAELSEFLPAGD